MRKIITSYVVNFFNYIYRLQRINHKKRMKKLNQSMLSGNICGEKLHSINGATLSIKNKDAKKDKEIQDNIEKIIEKYIDKPEEFFNFIKKTGTKIYKHSLADKILSKIDENEGFILPKKGLKALYLNLVLDKKFEFKTEEMFVLRSYNVNIYAFIYQFYNWYCYKMGLSGFESETQEKFKHVFEICETSKIDSLNYEEILNLKSAIKRDIEAIDFVKKMAIKFSMSKKNLEKIKQGEIVKV